MNGKHKTTRKPNSLFYSAKWSGVSHAPHCKTCKCPTCGERLHIEGQDTHYCPQCDDFKKPQKGCKHL